MASLDRYVIVERLASGGMGAVYHGKRLGPQGFQKECVLKQLLPEFTAQPQFIELFLREAKVSASLDHPNIVQTIDFVTTGNDHYIVMEFVHGADLRSVLRRLRQLGEALSPGAALFIVRELASALAYAFGRTGPDGQPLKLVHRDISPANVLISTSGEVKLVDFGIAKIPSQRSLFARVRGKLGYMAPELARGDAIDQRTDLYSLAVVLYEMLAGERLFAREEAPDWTKVPAVTSKRSGLPAELDAFMKVALDPEMGRRYQTAQEFGEALFTITYRHHLLVSATELADQLRTVMGDDVQYWREQPEGAVDVRARQPEKDLTVTSLMAAEEDPNDASPSRRAEQELARKLGREPSGVARGARQSPARRAVAPPPEAGPSVEVDDGIEGDAGGESVATALARRRSSGAQAGAASPPAADAERAGPVPGGKVKPAAARTGFLRMLAQGGVRSWRDDGMGTGVLEDGVNRTAERALPPPEPRRRPLLWIGLGLVVVASGIGGYWFLGRNRIDRPEARSMPTSQGVGVAALGDGGTRPGAPGPDAARAAVVTPPVPPLPVAPPADAGAAAAAAADAGAPPAAAATGPAAAPADGGSAAAPPSTPGADGGAGSGAATAPAAPDGGTAGIVPGPTRPGPVRRIPVRILSRPPAARVLVDGKLRCRTPCNLGKLASDRVYQLELRKTGFTPHQEILSVEADRRPRVINVRLARPVGETLGSTAGQPDPGIGRVGYLRLRTQPVGATILVDGQPTGQQARNTLLPLGAGPHRITLVHPTRGTQREIRVNIRASKTVTKTVKLD